MKRVALEDGRWLVRNGYGPEEAAAEFASLET